MIIDGDDTIPSIIAANVVDANQLISQTAEFGEGYTISRVNQPSWQHEALTNVMLLCEEEALRITEQRRENSGW